MKAFRSIRDQMRETAAFLSHPYSGPTSEPLRRQRQAEENEDELPPGIEPWMVVTFEELVRAGETGAPFMLMPCQMNGEPAAVIGFCYSHGGRTHVRPLFLACQPWMMFTAQAEEGGEDGEVAEAERLTL